MQDQPSRPTSVFASRYYLKRQNNLYKRETNNPTGWDVYSDEGILPTWLGANIYSHASHFSSAV
jgi:hypothetical protein